MAFRRFVSHRAAVVSCLIIGSLTIFVILAPFTARYGVNQSVQGPPNSFLSPRANAWLGTDDIGRDLYSRLIYGVRVSLLIGLASAIISVTLGALVGSVAGFRGGKFDDIMMRVTDLFLAFPFLVTLLVVRNVLGALPWLRPITGDMSSVRFIIVLFGLFGWMGVARIVRGQVLSLKEREFVEAARAVGASRRYIIARHLLPNSVGPIMVALTFSVVGAIIGESTLAFFGYGPQAGDGATSLGILVGAAKGAVQTGFWWLAVFPCLMLIVIALSINFIGDALRDATDPRLDRGV
ncbi:MAG: ABC transporter permease [Ilumatobacteraceae bacterium]|jgi:peptide/nickel transport system permease protein|nr:ABC transporter permease [Ilumatobacteraceae bacterium]